MIALAQHLGTLGGDPSKLRLFDQSGPELLAYATILAARETDETLRLIVGVYEWQDAPLMFLVDGDQLGIDPVKLNRVRRILAMRGDAPYLGIIQPGRLDVYRIALDRHALAATKVDIGVTDDTLWLTIPRLGNLRPGAQIQDRSWISSVILKLLDQAITALKQEEGLSGEDAVSLVGRALFMRFLADRNLLPSTSEIVAAGSGGLLIVQDHELFDTPDLIAQSCAWLDRTFNGDLLPLSPQVLQTLTAATCLVLGNILRRAPDSQLFLGWQERWADLNFSHIPVGVLSQAYEHYLRNHAPQQQRREGGFYTPATIANLMVAVAFKRLEAEGIAADAKVLDPAAGAGVFLLASFRELIAARWRRDGKRPDTVILREILANQIRGFDINEAALRFCALGLYLLSIELDPDPRPVDKLHFDDLRGVVLHRPIDLDVNPETQLGSLGPLIGTEHTGQYDLVIGNPPWASATGLKDWAFVLNAVHGVAVDRLGADTPAPPIPNEVLDIPFVWRAMSWAKPDAQIVLALHARLLFQQGDGMPKARQSVFDALDVTSVINGSELRQTKVWPSISAPFCLMFAINRPANAGSGFRLVTPRYERDLNSAGALRIDASNAYVVRPEELRQRPETLKILFRGSEADLSLYDRVRQRDVIALDAYWTEGVLVSGNGYQALRPSSPRRADGQRGQAGAHLAGLPHLAAGDGQSMVVNAAALPRFQGGRVHRARDLAIFQGPLLLIHQSPPVGLGRVRVAISDDSVLYNESWYGFSANGHPQGRTLVRYLALLLGSRVTLWIALITSGKFGFEREVVEKSVLENVVVPPFEHLDEAQHVVADKLFERIVQDEPGAWAAADAWVASLYGLGERDLDVIEDTLDLNLPFAVNRDRAQSPPDHAEIQAFGCLLEKELGPFAQRFGSRARVQLDRELTSSPWLGLRIVTTPLDDDDLDRSSDPSLALDLRALMIAADDLGATELVVEEDARHLTIGLLNQRRYWSRTQARLVAQRLIWTHPRLFHGRSPA